MFSRRDAVGAPTTGPWPDPVEPFAVETLVGGLDGPTQLFVTDDAWYVAVLNGGEEDGTGQVLRLDPTDLVERWGKARRYGVGVGKAGLAFKGSAEIKRKAEWPSWTPTANMIKREPQKYKRYAKGVPGGPDNPLGARALYLYKGGRDTYYRIHGTTQPNSIGRSVSNGCIRMINDHVIDLYNRVPLGTKVVVL